MDIYEIIFKDGYKHQSYVMQKDETKEELKKIHGKIIKIQKWIKAYSPWAKKIIIENNEE